MSVQRGLQAYFVTFIVTTERERPMKQFITLLVIAALAGCGAEIATSGVTAAAVKKKEIEEGKRTQDAARQKIEQATQATQQRSEKE